MSEQRIIIVDYGMGNLGSVRNMLKHLGFPSTITNDVQAIANADKLILSGVGAFDNAIENITELKLRNVLDRKVLDEKIPVLGICLGMQLFTSGSEEGERDGLGWIEGRTVRFRFEGDNAKLKVPHMGWNQVQQKKSSLLFQDMYDEPRFYFVHSFHVVADRIEDVLTTTQYGYEFTSSVEHDNIVGIQPHPEKSHKFGMKILDNFIRLI